MEDFALAAMRTLPVAVLAPIPAPVMARIVFGLALAGWCATGRTSGTLAPDSLAIELSVGLSLGLALMLASEMARAAGALVQRPFRTQVFDPLFAAIFWVTFLSGPHLVFLRGLSRVHVEVPDLGWVVGALPDLMAAVVETSLPLLMTYAVVHVLQRASERATGSPTAQAGLEPLLAALAVVVALHAMTADFGAFAETMMGGVNG